MPQSVVSQHRGTFGGVGMRYSVTVGETVLKSKAGVPEAAVVTTAYVREPRDRSRPVTFRFNGGPGSGSGGLQVGAFGATTGRRLIPCSTIPTACSRSPT